MSGLKSNILRADIAMKTSEIVTFKIETNEEKYQRTSYKI